MWRDREDVVGPVVFTATLWRLCDERIVGTRLPGIRAACAYAPQQTWAADIGLAPLLRRYQPPPRVVALAQRDVLPHHAPIAAVVVCHIVPSYERCCAQKIKPNHTCSAVTIPS